MQEAAAPPHNPAPMNQNGLDCRACHCHAGSVRTADQGIVIASSATPPVSTPQAMDGRLQRRNVLVGVLFGCGIIAFVDESVFHQLLHWHHFYDRSTPAIGLVSDGVFHAFSWFATVASLFLFADLRRRGALHVRRWLGGILVGIGAFQLFDGTVQHKLLDLHEVRYGVDLLPYDLLWNGSALLILLAGVVLLLAVRRAEARSHPRVR
jgi:uncharacterized membrane protein